MKPIIIQRLLQSIAELEGAIAKAKISFKEKGAVGEKMLSRINHYEQILEKQKNLTTSLCAHAVQGNWDEVNRHVRLINAFSLMIRDDARELLTPQLQTHTVEYHVEYLS